MIGASLAHSAAQENASMKANASTTIVADDRLNRSMYRNAIGTTSTPIAVATTRNPMAAPIVPTIVSALTSPPVTIFTTTVRMMRPSTSSATAAPSTIRASVVASALRSPNTLAVMPTLVAVERGPDVQRGVSGLSEAERDEPADQEGDRDTDRGHRHRRPADAPQFGEVHLHADLHEQQQHAKLGDCRHGLAVGRNPPEERRADDDADGDLADHGRHPDPLAQLGGELRGDQDHRDVEQHPGIVGIAARPCHRPNGRRHTQETNW